MHAGVSDLRHRYPAETKSNSRKTGLDSSGFVFLLSWAIVSAFGPRRSGSRNLAVMHPRQFIQRNANHVAKSKGFALAVAAFLFVVLVGCSQNPYLAAENRGPLIKPGSPAVPAAGK